MQTQQASKEPRKPEQAKASWVVVSDDHEGVKSMNQVAVRYNEKKLAISTSNLLSIPLALPIQRSM